MRCQLSIRAGDPGPALCRDRAAVVLVGDVGLQLERTPFYEREISLRFARSYGPGRYDPSYEAWGVDYQAGQVRWTEGRNFEAVLDRMAAGRLRVSEQADTALQELVGYTNCRTPGRYRCTTRRACSPW